MNRYTSVKIVVCAVLFALLITSCKHHENEYHNIIDKIEAESNDHHGVSITSDPFLSEYNLMKITEDGHSFMIPERKSQIKSYKCTECHTTSLDKMQNENSDKKAHWDMELIHADGNTMNCTTCHNPNDMNNLKSLTGNKIDLNKSYKLCSQCHTKQFNDWKGGAHGKSVKSWAPPRASLTCVNCHNPHNPSFHTRWPARFNTQKIQERK